MATKVTIDQVCTVASFGLDGFCRRMSFCIKWDLQSITRTGLGVFEKTYDGGSFAAQRERETEELFLRLCLCLFVSGSTR